MTEVFFREDNGDKFVPFKDLRMGDVFKTIDESTVFLKIPPVRILSTGDKGSAIILKGNDNDITGTIVDFYEDQMVTMYDKIKITGYK